MACILRRQLDFACSLIRYHLSLAAEDALLLRPYFWTSWIGVRRERIMQKFKAIAIGLRMGFGTSVYRLVQQFLATK
jgi:hypothetical protein